MIGEFFLDVTEDDLYHCVSELIFPFIENKNFMKKVRVYLNLLQITMDICFDTDLLKAAGHNSKFLLMT